MDVMRNGPSEMLTLANAIRQKPSDLINSLQDEDKQEKKEEKAYSIYDDEL